MARCDGWVGGTWVVAGAPQLPTPIWLMLSWRQELFHGQRLIGGRKPPAARSCNCCFCTSSPSREGRGLRRLAFHDRNHKMPTRFVWDDCSRCRKPRTLLIRFLLFWFESILFT
ncbi:hypothetical protein ACP70R_010684 [Stipagrostis hirtigluma subsp. patula]